jgi:hypothetical protein
MDFHFSWLFREKTKKENQLWEVGLSGARCHVGGIVHLFAGGFLCQALDDGGDIVAIILLLGNMLLHKFRPL